MTNHLINIERSVCTSISNYTNIAILNGNVIQDDLDRLWDGVYHHPILLPFELEELVKELLDNGTRLMNSQAPTFLKEKKDLLNWFQIEQENLPDYFKKFHIHIEKIRNKLNGQPKS